MFVPVIRKGQTVYIGADGKVCDSMRVGAYRYGSAYSDSFKTGDDAEAVRSEGRDGLLYQFDVNRESFPSFETEMANASINGLAGKFFLGNKEVSTVPLIRDGYASMPLSERYRPLISPQVACNLCGRVVPLPSQGMQEAAIVGAEVICPDCDNKPDVCRYAKPVPVKWPEAYGGETVRVSLKSSELPSVKGDGNRYALPQAEQWAFRRLTALRDSARQRIARICEWPFCGHTQRNVSVRWIGDVAHWTCGECA